MHKSLMKIYLNKKKKKKKKKKRKKKKKERKKTKRKRERERERESSPHSIMIIPVHFESVILSTMSRSTLL